MKMNMKKESIFNYKIILISLIFFTMRIQSTFAEAVAVANAVNANAPATANPASENGLSKFNQSLNSPTGIILLSLVGLANSYTIHEAAKDEASEAEKNIAKIETLMTTFSDSWSGHCPKGHEDINDASCYCYLDSGKKNLNRTNSQTCQSLWSKTEYQLTANGKDYRVKGEEADTVGCLYTNGKFDEKCQCKKFADSKGNNLCAKVTSLNVNTNSMGSFISQSSVPTLVDTLNKMASGNLGLNGLNIGNAAIKQNELTNKYFKHIGDDLKKMGIPARPTLKELDKMTNAVLPKKAIDGYTKSMGSMPLLASTNPPPTMSKAIEEAKKKAGLESFDGKNLGLKKTEEGKNLNFNFNDGGGSNTAQNLNIPEEEKVYKVKGDIVKDTGASIFQVISNRYQESGIRKLFDDEQN